MQAFGRRLQSANAASLSTQTKRRVTVLGMVLGMVAKCVFYVFHLFSVIFRNKVLSHRSHRPTLVFRMVQDFRAREVNESCGGGRACKELVSQNYVNSVEGG